MSRNISIKSIIPLPRMTRISLITLGWQMLTAALALAGEGLPLFLERARKRLSDELDIFKATMQPRELNSWSRAQLSRELNAAWSALFAWMEGMIGMPKEGAPQDLPALRTLHTHIFEDGLAFLRTGHREKWIQSEERIKIIDEEFEQPINNCGGAAFLAPLREAHKNFGELLGFTAPVQPDNAAEARKHYTAFSLALRTYIGKVIFYADPEEPGSEELSQALLVPLVQWKDTPHRSTRDEEEDISDDLVVDVADDSLPALEEASE